jgi:hypothetical protein
MNTQQKSVFLAIFPPSGKEVHIKWDSYNNVQDANKELNIIRSLLIGQKKKPYDCYVYEADVPEYGLKSHVLDDVDMNFYEENNVVDQQELQSKLDQAIHEVGILAKEEKRGSV